LPLAIAFPILNRWGNLSLFESIRPGTVEEARQIILQRLAGLVANGVLPASLHESSWLIC